LVTPWLAERSLSKHKECHVMLSFLNPQIYFGGEGGGGGGGGNDSGGDGSASSGTAPAALPAPAPVATNSFTETLANLFTPGDGASYVGGQLVDDATNTSIAAGSKSSTGNVIAGTANTKSNDNRTYQDAAFNSVSRAGGTVPAKIGGQTDVSNAGASNPNAGALGSLPTSVSSTQTGSSATGALNQIPKTNSTKEELANLFTPNDGAVYVNGQLIDQATGNVIAPGGQSSTGSTIRGIANTSANDIANYAGYGSAPIVNSSRETLANIITPSDNAMYVNGQLVNTLTGESLEGGGYTIDPVTKEKDYIYGVSDDFSNNTLDTAGMNESEIAIEKANQQMRQDIPPSDLAYFASFLGGAVIPYFGGPIATAMLDKSIAERRAIMDEQTAALEAGATPQFNEAGDYIGYNDTYESEMAGTFGTGNIYTENTLGASTQNFGNPDGTGNYIAAQNTLADGRSIGDSDSGTAAFGSGDAGGGSGEMFSGSGGGTTRTRPTYGNFYGGRSGGIWDRFSQSFLTRFNNPTEGIDEMVRVVTGADGSKLYYNVAGELLNPDSVAGIRTGGDPTVMQIGEEEFVDYSQMSDEELFKIS